jgi:hypothetical protein
VVVTPRVGVVKQPGAFVQSAVGLRPPPQERRWRQYERVAVEVVVFLFLLVEVAAAASLLVVIPVGWCISVVGFGVEAAVRLE